MQTFILGPPETDTDPGPGVIDVATLLKLLADLAGQEKSNDQGALLRHAFDNMTQSLQKNENMKMTRSELRHCIKECVKQMREAVLPDENDEVDLSAPDVLWNNAYDMDDQETSTKVANMRIRIDPDCADEIEDMAKFVPQLKMLAMGESLQKVSESAPEGWERVVKKLKRDKNKKGGSAKNPWALAYWMKDKGYKPKK